MTLNVNLFGGPGVGKSVLAAELFVALKKRGIHAELVTEYAKELVYAGRITDVDQLLIVEEQHRRQERLQGKVQVVITDAPVPLSLVYSQGQQHLQLSAKVRQLTAHWRNLNILLHRDLATGYEPQGRYQSQAEATAFHLEQVVPFVRSFYAGDVTDCEVAGAVAILVARILPLVSPHTLLGNAPAPTGVKQPLQVLQSVEPQYAESNWAHNALLLMDEADWLVRLGSVCAEPERYASAAKAFWDVCHLLSTERYRLHEQELKNRVSL